MPDVALLSAIERSDLRALFKDYAIALLNVQKRSDLRSVVDVAGLVASFAATWLTPVGLPATIFGTGVFVRNRLADRAWRRRMADLKRLSEWIQNLL